MQPINFTRRQNNLSANKARSGFSLVEVLVGVVFMTMSFTALYVAFSSGFQFVQLCRENQRAGQILTEKLETVRLYTWDQINTAGFVPTNFTATFYPPSQTNSGLVYSGIMTIAPMAVAETYSNDLRRVDVTLTWTNAGCVRTRSMTTMISQYGIQNYRPN